jgi:hypothetical protein
MIVLKLALLTCVFYLAIAVLAEAAFLAAAHLMGGLGARLTFWVIFFALDWAISISLAWRVLAWRMPHGG